MQAARARRLVVLALGLATLGCSRTPEPVSGPGRPRVVSLHDVTTEMWVAFSATATLVGVAEPIDVPPEVTQAIEAVPRVGGLESILALRPTLVLGLAVVEERDPELVARLRDAGVEVQLADPATVEDVVAFARRIGARVGATERVESAIRALVEATALGPAEMMGAQKSGPEGPRPLRVFVYDCCNPPFTAGGRTVLTDLIARAGGTNIFADLPSDWTHVTWEEVLARRPEHVVVHAYPMEGQGDVPEKLRTLREFPGLSTVPVTILPLGFSLGGLRSGEGLARLRAAFSERS